MITHYNNLWKDTCRLFDKVPDPCIFQVILDSYGSSEKKDSENYRHYHTIEHVAFILEQFHIFKYNFKAVCPEEIEMALWFHDLVYLPGSKQNEQRSANIAKMACTSLGLDRNQINRICKMIVLSNHFRDDDVKTEDERIFLDLDISILSEEWDSLYSMYMKDVKKEYVPFFCDEVTYIKGRIEILRAFNNKEYMYHSDWFRKNREHIARSNVQRELSIMKTELEKLKKK